MYNRLIPIFLLLHLWRMARSDDTAEVENCAPVQCGGLNISYPLWVSGKQPEHCGYPSLEINCYNEKPFLVESYDTNYYIDRVFYDNNSFVLVNSILVNRTNNCSLPSLNVSLGLGPMEVSKTNKELVFFSDCNQDVRASKDYFPVTCALPEPGNANVSFVRLFENYTDDGTVVPGESLGNCTVSRIPVSGWNGSAVDQYVSLMNDGFLVELKVDSCSGCRNSNGVCGFNATTSMFMCACPDGSVSPVSCPSPDDHRRSDSKHRTIIIGSAIAAAVALMIFVSIICIIRTERLCLFPKKYRAQNEIELLIEKYGSLAPRRYNYRELKKITKSFQQKLGKGGFGTVYRGSLPDGHFVAVKFLNNPTSNGEEFLSEVISIGRTSHVNVVSLLGFCIEGSKRALVYEYMPNGSLDNYIYSKDPKVVLGWQNLFDIAIGIARGLEYLHRGCNTRIVHFDIKPANILLDDDFNPKVADFGLAKLCQPKESIVSLAEMRGTIGFIAPEVFSRSFGVPSTKSDVYSYGMMVLEMVGGRKNANSNVERSSQEYFPHWIYDCLSQGGEIQASDITNETEGIARKMAIVGLWCIQTLPASRPSMREVVEMMEKNSDELEMPPKPYLSSPQNSIILSLNSSSY